MALSLFVVIEHFDGTLNIASGFVRDVVKDSLQPLLAFSMIFRLNCSDV